MAFAFVQAIAGDDDSATLTTTAGSLVVAWVAWENSTGTTGLTSVTDGAADTFTLGPATGNGATSHQQFAWHLGVTGGGQVFLVTLPAGAVLSSVIAMEFTHGASIALDVGDNEGTNTGNGTALTSGSVTIATTGESELVLAGGNSYSVGSAFSAEQINTVAADGSQEMTAGNARCVLWYRILTSAFTGTATATGTISDDWGCHILAFKEPGGAPAGKPRTTMTLLGVG